MRAPSIPSVLLLALLTALTAASPAQATPPLRTWSLAGNGTWNTPGNWSPNGIPVAGDSVFVPLSLGLHTVTLDVDPPTIHSFVQLSPTATFDLAGHTIYTTTTSTSAGILLASGAAQGFSGLLHTLASAQTSVVNGAALNMNSDWQNDGHVVIHSTAGSSASRVSANYYMTLSGTGDLQLADQANALLTSPSGYLLIHGAGHLIHGAGRVTLPLTNHGTITADYAAGNTLSIENALTNDGTLRSTNGAKLLLTGTVANTGGLVLADGGNVELNGTTLSNGLFRTTGASVIETSANSTVTGPFSLAGTMNVNSGHVLTYGGGTLADSGTIVVHPSGASASTFRLGYYLTLAGPGSLLLGDATLATLDSPSGYLLTHNAGHTIHGAGNILTYLTNHGTVSADVSGKALTLSNWAITNDGTMLATGGGTLAFSGATIMNTGGVIKANGGNVTMTNEAVNAGSLSGANTFTFAGSNTLTGVTSSSPLQVNGGATLNTSGTIPNTGNIMVREPSGTGAATLRLAYYTTLSGSGAVQLTDATQSIIDSPSGYTLTNAADHTVHGTGTTTLPITNHGLISSDVTGKALTMSSTIINDGTIQAVGGGSLQINGPSFANTGGTLAATSGDIRISGTTLGGGALTSGTGNSITFNGTSTISSGITSKAALKINGGVTLVLGNATLTDSGTVQLRSPGDTATALIRANYYTQLAGPGTLTLTHGTQSVIDSPSGYTLTNQATHTIRGTGVLSLPLVNLGLLSANVPDSTLQLTFASLNLTGTQVAANGGKLVFTAVTPNYASNTLTGGTWKASANSLIRFPAADIRHLAASASLDGLGSDLISADSSVSALRRLGAIDLGGSFSVRNGRLFSSSAGLASSGIVDVGPGSVLTVGGSGSGGFQMDSTATYLVELSGRGAGGWGKIVVNGNVSMNGHLRIRILDGFVPVLTDTFEIMNYSGSRLGDFATTDSQIVAPHVAMSQIWRGNRLLLVAKYHSGVADVPPGSGDGPLPQALAFSARGGAGGRARLELALPSAAVVDVSLFDIGGRRVATLARDAFAAGRWTWNWDATRERTASGMYFARARVSMGGATRDLTARVVLWR